MKIQILKDKCFKLSQALDKALLNQRESQLQVLQLQQAQMQEMHSVNQKSTAASGTTGGQREVAQLATLVAALKRDNDGLRMRLENKQEFSRQVELEDRIKEKDQIIVSLSKDIKSLQRIQNDQGRALYRITNEHDYP